MTPVVKNLLASAGDISDPSRFSALRISPGEGNDYPLHYSCLENPMDRVAWQVAAHRVTESWTRLKPLRIVCMNLAG